MASIGWFSVLLLASAPAAATTYRVGIGDDCDPGNRSGCFYRNQLTIRVGDVQWSFTAMRTHSGRASIMLWQTTGPFVAHEVAKAKGAMPRRSAASSATIVEAAGTTPTTVMKFSSSIQRAGCREVPRRGQRMRPGSSSWTPLPIAMGYRVPGTTRRRADTASRSRCFRASPAAAAGVLVHLLAAGRSIVDRCIGSDRRQPRRAAGCPDRRLGGALPAEFRCRECAPGKLGHADLHLQRLQSRTRRLERRPHPATAAAAWTSRGSRCRRG